MNLDDAAKGLPGPEEFEPILAASPDDLMARESALCWFALIAPDVAQAKHHTREMVRWHPDSPSIYAMNMTLFDRDPGLREEIESSLEALRASGRSSHGSLATLASVVGHRAVVPRFETEVDRRRWLQYFQLPDDYPTERHADEGRALRAVGYFREAIASARQTGDSFAAGLYATQLLDVLIALERREAAASVAAEGLATIDRAPMPDLQLRYGGLLADLGRWDDARRAFDAAIDEDQKRFQSCGHVAARARLGLGMVALVHDNDRERAVEQLIAAASVPPCMHTQTQGIGIKLARKLAAAGERDAVRRYCEIVLRDICPGDGPSRELLESLG